MEFGLNNFKDSLTKKNKFKLKIFSKGLPHILGKYYCAVCNSRVNRFISLKNFSNGKFVRDLNVSGVMHPVLNYETLSIDSFFCPICGAQDKARLYAHYFGLKKSTFSNEKLLHFAPESGFGQHLNYRYNFRYFSADLYRDDVDLKVDITKMSDFSAEAWDIIICSHLLEHIENDDLALSEIYRVLKIGGFAIIMVPILLSINSTYEDSSITTEEGRFEHFGLEDHLRIYSKSDFTNKLLYAGFKVESLDINFFGEKIFNKLGLSKTSILYVVRKI
jgi:hypothetical protein